MITNIINRLTLFISIVFYSMNISAQLSPKSLNIDTLDIRTKDSFVLPKYFTQKKNDSILTITKPKIQSKNLIEISDSLKKNRLREPNDSLSISTKSFYSLQQDSLKKSELIKKIKTVIPHGNLSVGCDYGFLPYTVNMPSPAFAIKTEGRLEMDLVNIPVDIVYFYSSQKNVIGLNNYFRISYNSERYKEKLNSKLGGSLDSYKRNLFGLNSRRQQLMQNMAYTDYLSSINPDKWPVDSLAIKNKISFPETKLDTSELFLNPIGLDTTGLLNTISDTVKNNSAFQKTDSATKHALLYKHKSDSVAKAYNAYKDQYALLSDSIKTLQKKIDQLESLNVNPSYSQKSPYLTKVQNFLSGVKKIDLGLCYPAYSTFLANNIPVRGINFEYEKNNIFLAFTYGTTVSTLLYNNRNVEGFLQNVRNSYNYFDANNLAAGRKILSLKFGVGKKEANHFFAGFLIGKGAGIFSQSNPESPKPNYVETNLVLELDIRRKLSKNTVLDIIAGKSSVQDENISLETIRTAAKEIFSNYRSYALLAKLRTSIPATKSNFNFSIRWVDPFFNSFGIGFMRSDNMRYEAKLDQPLGKSLLYTVAVRHEEDNLLKLLNYKNTFYSINNTLSYKIKRGLVLRVGYTPLIRTLRGANYSFTNKNSIVTGIVTFSPKSKEVQKQYSLLYNSYHVTTDSTPLNFQNFAYYHQFSFKGGFKTGLNVSWFKNNLNDSTSNDLFLAVLDLGYQFKNGSSFSVAGKSAYRKNGQFYPGFLVKSTLKLSRTLFWENQIEKFIVGNLFNGYDLENLQKFPYCYSTKLILNF